MLILFNPTLGKELYESPLAKWPGPHVVVLPPDRTLERADINRLKNQFLVIEWLSEPENAVTILADTFLLLKNHLEFDDGPLLYLNHSTKDTLLNHIDPDMPPYAINAELSHDQVIEWLALGEMIATSPLLPSLLQTLNRHNVCDATVIDIISEEMAGKNA